MFRRRTPVPLWWRLRGWLWPQIGWRRLGRYLVKRVTRLPGTPHSIAAGFAAGTVISFTPFLGFHTILSILLSFLLRGNYLAAVAGSVVGNPWTFPIIWVTTYQLGHFLLGTTPSQTARLEDPDLVSRWQELKGLVWPMAVGSVPLGALAGLLVYFPVARMITAYQGARRRRLQHRQAERRGRFGISDPNASPGAGVP
jgi:uncharacterized protein (DUF2062 family)